MTPAQREILTTVAWRHGVTVGDILSENRQRKFAYARQEAMYLMRVSGRWSTPLIGRVLGGRDHSTVCHGADAHAARHGLPIHRVDPQPNAAQENAILHSEGSVVHRPTGQNHGTVSA